MSNETMFYVSVWDDEDEMGIYWYEPHFSKEVLEETLLEEYDNVYVTEAENA